MAIVHSDITAKAPNDEYDESPYRVWSKTGIDLVREKNGEVRTGTLNGEDVFYVDTNDGEDVNLQANSKPAYYQCGEGCDGSHALPATGNASARVEIMACLVLGGLLLFACGKRAGRSQMGKIVP